MGVEEDNIEIFDEDEQEEEFDDLDYEEENDNELQVEDFEKLEDDTYRFIFGDGTWKDLRFPKSVEIKIKE